jgi:hypothetical protein
MFHAVEEGEGKAVLDGVEHRIKPGFAVLVPAGTPHNIINGPSGPMKLYTLYAPPNHSDGVGARRQAEADKEHFDGKTTELAIASRDIGARPKSPQRSQRVQNHGNVDRFLKHRALHRRQIAERSDNHASDRET